ncbi:MAG: hypothetical protein AAFY02_14325 [Pseudomonadota bacterium]
MTILTAVLAFAVTMILLSTLVAAAVEIINEARGQRKRHMTYLLGAVFDDVIWPSFGDHLSKEAKLRALTIDAAVNDPVALDPASRATRRVLSISRWFGRVTGPFWWVLAVLAVLLLYLFDYTLIAVATIIAIAFFRDHLREPLRFNYPTGATDDPRHLKALERLDALLRRYAKAATLYDWPSLTDRSDFKPAEIWQEAHRQIQADITTRAEMLMAGGMPRGQAILRAKRDRLRDTGLFEEADLQQASLEEDRAWAETAVLGEDPAFRNEALLELYLRLRIRERFIKDIGKIAASVAASPGEARRAFTTRLSATDFAERLATSDFGPAIKRATGGEIPAQDLAAAMAAAEPTEPKDGVALAAQKLKVVLAQTLRRFDAKGDDTRRTFAARARNWSIFVAFILAFAANVNVFTLARAYYEDPDLATKVVESHELRMETLQTELTALTARMALATPQERAGLKEEIEAVQDRMAALNDLIVTEIDSLSVLGVPVGWSYFPFCLGSLDQTPEAACQAIEDARSGPEGNAFTDYLAFFERAQREGPTALQAQWDRLPEVLQDLMANYASEESGAEVNLRESLGAPDRAWNKLLAHIDAARLWLETRNQQGLVEWVLGVLLGGALIGLGSPFWFDIYRRLSSVAAIAGRLTGRGQAAAGNQVADAAAPKDPETTHKPEDIFNAFMTALAAREAIQTATAEPDS